MSGASNYIIELTGSDLIYDVRVNDWIIASGERSRRSLFESLTNIQTDGKNKVTISLRLPPSEEVAPPSTEFEVRIRDSDMPLYHFQWQRGNPQFELPLQREGEFLSSTQYGLWSWQRAAQVSLDDTTKQGVASLITRLHQALDSRDLEETVRLFAIRDRERAIALGDPVEQEEIAARDDYSESFADPKWRMQPLNPEQFRYTLMANGHVVLVVAGDGRDVLRSAPDSEGSIIGFGIYASLLNGTWTVIH